MENKNLEKVLEQEILYADVTYVAYATTNVSDGKTATMSYTNPLLDDKIDKQYIEEKWFTVTPENTVITFEKDDFAAGDKTVIEDPISGKIYTVEF